VFVILTVLTTISLVPFLWVISSAFKDNTEIFGSMALLPESWKWDNFKEAWVGGQFGRYFINTIIVAVGTTAIRVAVAAPAGYEFAKTQLKYASWLFYLYLFGITLPIESIIVPLFFQVKDLGLVNSHLGLILALVGTGVPFGVYLMRSFFRDLPDALGEAARLDGASEWEIFFRIMMPLAKPGLLALGVFSFLGAWNEYFLSILLLITEDTRTIPLGLVRFQQTNMTDYGAMFAAITLAIIPSLLIYVVLQRQFISGLAAGATKG
ncbi:MAG: carbohydrate ABC transporter permease, partial [Ornithinimicrobium sp.]|uniref:carbohydrate ABC transporter permease n=1 Tax=Ornithinimicrobium sp. TaxID=1977084 RepID=UPI003D9AF225